MDVPQRAAATDRRKGEARTVQPFDDIARRVDPQEEERHSLRAGAVQGGQPMRHLFEAGTEQVGKRFDVIAARFRRLCKALVRHPQGRCGIAGERATSEDLCRLAGKTLAPQQR